ncbi:conserved hypothetical protein [Nitrobacter winogradskyi Nb-255]|uniref:Uncharacterized protein n=1 Tax=Nitrobacter winogradskyi (strain ATCC 25391 / DSM 10237 / CIP 104748 / NCIMB 11846 / Nb-255) TaxID=323098 RepID=Q3SNW9_NITWN|nr:hypothetical protein [Nitrobacter winogradskyi]ABA06022.1 conserved hypothetical protein [Nitrobacter winogradskyi Nb-255]
MLQVSAGFLAGLAVTLSLGAVHLESNGEAAVYDAAVASVHRAVKSDLGIVPSPNAGGRTVSVRLQSLPRMSIVFRLPDSGQEARDRGVKRGLQRSPAARVKRTIACEPVVSMLTDVAKRLQPGRCVT